MVVSLESYKRQVDIGSLVKLHFLHMSPGGLMGLSENPAGSTLGVETTQIGEPRSYSAQLAPMCEECIFTAGRRLIHCTLAAPMISIEMSWAIDACYEISFDPFFRRNTQTSSVSDFVGCIMTRVN